MTIAMTVGAEKINENTNDIDKSLVLRRIDSDNANASAILLIHGWGSSSEIWNDCIELLRKQFDIYLLDLPGHGLNIDASFASADDFVKQFARQHLPTMPKRFSIIGWSLGGLLASLLAQQFSNHITALVTIATNCSFVSHDDWPQAMPANVFNNFYQQLNTNEQAVVLGRFFALQTQGVPSTRKDLKYIKELLRDAVYCHNGLQQGLNWLADYDLLSCWDELALPTLRQFGAHDNLVPRAAAELLAKRYPNNQLEVFDGSSHLPFISERDNWLASTVDFIQSSESQVIIDKREIEKSFSNAADSYDSIAVFQHAVGKNLLTFLPEADVRRVLDLGAGTGYFSTALRQCYPPADIVEVDISSRMLARCQSRAVDNFQVQADIESLPFSPQSFDIIFSSLSIQWCHDLEKVFQDIADSLSVGGVAVLTTLVDGSLSELKEAWSSVDDAVHVNEFESEAALKDSCEKSGLKFQQWLVEDDMQTFSSIRDLIRSVKDIGAHNMHPGRPKGLMGKNKYRQFVSAYNTLRTEEGAWPLTYRVLYMVLQK
jgi:malonyl-CoA O-methyltransferase